MKKFENLGRSIAKAEQRNIIGGFIPPDDGNYCTVSCTGSVGQWHYTSMPTCRGIMADVGTYCRSGEGAMAPGCQCTM